MLGHNDIVSKNFPTLIPNLINVSQISAGFSHSLVLNQNGVFSFGENFVKLF
jgi:hypothetical protein